METVWIKEYSSLPKQERRQFKKKYVVFISTMFGPSCFHTVISKHFEKQALSYFAFQSFLDIHRNPKRKSYSNRF